MVAHIVCSMYTYQNVMITTDIVLYPGHPTLDYFLEIVTIFAFF